MSYEDKYISSICSGFTFGQVKQLKLDPEFVLVSVESVSVNVSVLIRY